MNETTLKTPSTVGGGQLSDEDMDAINGGIIPVAVGIGLTVVGGAMIAAGILWPSHDLITPEVRNAGKP